MLARERGEARTKRLATNRYPSEDELASKFVLIRDDVSQTRPLRDALVRLSASLTEDKGKATVFVVADAANLSDDFKLHAGLNGAYVMMPSVLTDGRGVCLKFKDATKTKRKIFMTEAFKLENEAAAKSIEDKVGPTWKALTTIDEFALAKQTATKNNASASVIACIGSGEGHIFATVKHCFKVGDLISFLSVVDHEQSALSIFVG